MAAAILCSGLGVPRAGAATIIKKATGTDLSLAASWTTTPAFNGTDVATWNSTATSFSTLTIGSGVSFAGLVITNPKYSVTIDPGTTGSALILGASGIDMSNAAAFLTLDCNVVLSHSQTWNITTNSHLQMSGVISGAATLTKSGGANLALFSPSTYTGGTALTAGSITIYDGNALGSGPVTLSAGAGLNAGGTMTINNTLSLTGNVTLGAMSSTYTVTFSAANNKMAANTNLQVGIGTLVFPNGISGSGYSLTKSGPYGIVELDGVSTYTGGTTVSGGTLIFGSATSLAGTGRNLTLTSGAVAATNYPMDQAFLNRINVASSGIVALGIDNSNNLDFSSGGANLPLVSLGATGSVNYSGTLTPGGGTYRLGGGGGILTLTNDGVLSGANNVIVASTSAQPNSEQVVLAGNNSVSGTLSVSGENLVVDGNLTTGALTLLNYGAIYGSGNLTAPSYAAQSGTLGVNLTGPGGLTKTTAGLLGLEGNNTYSGGTNLSAGQLDILSSSALGTGSFTIGNGTTIDGNNLVRSVTVNNAYILAGNFTFAAGSSLFLAGPGTMAANRTITVSQVLYGGQLTLAGPISGNGSALTKAGPGTLELDGVNTYTGGTVLSSGTLVLGPNASIGPGALTLGNGTTLTSTAYPTITLSNPTVIDGVVSVSDVTLNGPITLNRPSTLSDAILIGGAIGDGGHGFGLTVGSNLLILTGANTYTGVTTIIGSGYQQAVLQIGTGGTTGSLAPSGAIVDNGSLVFNRSNGIAVPNSISGTGTVTQNGTGTLSLSAANTYTGNTVINAGTLELDLSAHATGVLAATSPVLPHVKMLPGASREVLPCRGVFQGLVPV